jgi:hypothetical protein
MTPLGFKRKDLNDGSYCCPASTTDSKDYENELVYPEINVVGKQADVMGADQLELGDEIEITLRLKVKGLRDDSRLIDGKKQRDLNLTLQILEASDFTVVSEGDAGTEKESSADEDSPVHAMLAATADK